MRLAHHVSRAAHDRAERDAGEEEHADDRQQDPDDRRAGRTDRKAERPLESPPEVAAVPTAERGHQAEEADAEPETERPQRDQLAARDDQRAERTEDRGREKGGPAGERLRRVPDRPTGKTEPEHGRQEDADGDQREADELGMTVSVGALRPTLPFPRARPGRALFPRHPRELRPARARSS